MFALDHKQQTPITFNQLKLYIKFILPAVLLCGYFIFLIYFWQNKFFPNMDILNWTSLLIPSFLLGIMIPFFVFLFLAAIGYSWSRSIIDNKVLFKNFILHTNGLSSYDVYLKKITKIYLIFPLIMSEILLGLIEFIPIKQKALLFIFLIIVLITALVTRFYCKDHLPCKLFAKCFYVIFFLVLFSSFLCVCGRPLLNDTVKTHFDDIQYSSVIIYAISTVITLFLISYNILEFLKENKQNILIRILQPAIIFFCMMNVSWIPGWIVKFMNLGNYQAEQIYSKINCI